MKIHCDPATFTTFPEPSPAAACYLLEKEVPWQCWGQGQEVKLITSLPAAS